MLQSMGSQRVRQDLVTEHNNSSHLLDYEIIHPYENWQPHTQVPLLPSEMAHTLSMVCISSLNKPFTLLWLTLEFRAKNSHLAAVLGIQL